MPPVTLRTNTLRPANFQDATLSAHTHLALEDVCASKPWPCRFLDPAPALSKAESCAYCCSVAHCGLLFGGFSITLTSTQRLVCESKDTTSRASGYAHGGIVSVQLHKDLCSASACPGPHPSDNNCKAWQPVCANTPTDVLEMAPGPCLRINALTITNRGSIKIQSHDHLHLTGRMACDLSCPEIGNWA